MNKAKTPGVWQTPGVLSKEQMNTYIASRYNLFLKDLEKVVNIDSGTHFIQGVERVITYFEERFSALQWHPRRHQFSREVGPCLEVLNGHSSSEQEVYDILCLGHIDTVFQEGTAQARPFSIIGGRGMGPGVVDILLRPRPGQVPSYQI